MVSLRLHAGLPSGAVRLGVVVVVLCAFLMMAGCEAVDIRVAVFEWASVDATNTIWDGEYTQGVSSNFLLAAQHFNARRVDIIPALAEVAGCNKNISIVSFCETAGNPLRGTSDLLYVLNTFAPIHAIAGFGGIEDAIAGSLLAKAAANLPVISHWVSAPRVSDKQVFPLFARTCVSDYDHAVVVAKFMSQFSFQTVLLIYLTDGRDFANRFALELKQYGIQLRSFEFQYVDETYSESIDEIVALASKLDLKAIVVASWAAQLSLLANAFAANQMLGPETNYFFTYLDRNPTPQEFSSNGHLRSLFNGGIRVARVVDAASNANWRRHLDAWPTYESSYFEDINGILPPHGANNSQSCENSNFQYRLKPGYFSRTVGLANEVWAQSYDTVLAYGMAVCRLAPTGSTIPNGTEIYDQLLREGFSGMSSPDFKFTETGDPDVASAGFKLVNFRASPSGVIQPSFVGSFNASSREFDVDISAVQFRGGLGVLPKDIVPPIESRNQLPDWARAVTLGEFGLLMCIALACAWWLVAFRTHKIVVNSQIPLMWLILIGCSIAASALIPLTADDGNGLDENVSCMLVPVLFTLGFQLSTLAIAIKTYRIHVLFHNPKLKTIRLPVKKMLAFLGLFLSLPTIVVIVWWTLSPLKFIRVVNYQDTHGNPIESFGMCDAPTPLSGAMLVLNFLCYGACVVGVTSVAYKVRNVPSEYHEAKWVALALSSQTQIFFIAIPTIAAVYRVVLGRFILISLIIFASVSVVLAGIFFPKMYATITGKDALPGWMKNREGKSYRNSKDHPSPPSSPFRSFPWHQPLSSPKKQQGSSSETPVSQQPKAIGGNNKTATVFNTSEFVAQSGIIIHHAQIGSDKTSEDEDDKSNSKSQMADKTVSDPQATTSG